MADKQATVYVIDIGKSMGDLRNGCEETDLDFVLRYLCDQVTTIVCILRLYGSRKIYIAGLG
jgi:ATP-dependent DNA helicase 2 subunit 2